MPDDPRITWTDEKSDPRITWDSEPEEKTLGGFVANIPESGAKLIGGTVSAVAHPVKTIENLGQVLLGAVGVDQYATQRDAVLQHFKDRYGSLEAAWDTFYKDPVGVAADVSTVFGGVSGLARGVGALSRVAGAADIASAASTAGKVAGTVAAATDPLALAGQVVGAGVRGTGVAQRLYQSALIPGLAKKNIPKIAGEIQTGLEAGIPVSEGGAGKLSGLIDDLNSQIDKIVASKPGVTVSPKTVAARTGDVSQRFATQVNPEADLSAIASSRAEFVRQHRQQIGTDFQGNPIYQEVPIPATEVQTLKKGTYQQLRGKYGELSAAAVEAQKALARGLKEELATQFPELTGLNAKESKFIDLDGQLERSVARYSNRRIASLGPLITGGAVAAGEGVGRGFITGVLHTILDDPNLKSRLAIAIHHAQKLNPGKWGVSRTGTLLSRIDEYVNSLAQPNQ